MTPEQRSFLELAVVEQYTYAKIEEVMGITRDTMTKWWEELKTEREQLSKIRSIWRKKFRDIGFGDFEIWYSKTDKRCYYCGATADKIYTLISSGLVRTKRLPTRGRSLEIERLDPNKPYDVTDNLVFSCYWCNNAKSDEFSAKEFKRLGRVIGKIWEERESLGHIPQ